MVAIVNHARLIAVRGLFNFRDVGGYRGHGDRTVRWGRLYRSDSLHRIADADRGTFETLGIRTVIDLRRPYEIDENGRVAGFEKGYHNIHPRHTPWELSPDPEPGQDGLAQWLSSRYLELARDGYEGIAAAIQLICDRRTAPVVVHCQAGKDRTGVVCALTLSLLGVDDRDIGEDYALSTQATRRHHEWSERHYDLNAPHLASPAEAITLFLAQIRLRYGSVEEYLVRAGLDGTQFDSLRDHLLE